MRNSMLSILVILFAVLAVVPVSAEEASVQEPVVTDMHDAAVSLAKKYVCFGREGCWEERGDEISSNAHMVVDECLEESWFPNYACLWLVAVVSNEGGMRSNPTCGGLDSDCISGCDYHADGSVADGGKVRQSCYLECAMAEGVDPDSKRMNRIHKCNDRGTSFGPFQLKESTVAECRRLMDDKGFDPYSFSESASCYMLKIHNAERKVLGICPKTKNTWSVAMKRVGAGPYTRFGTRTTKDGDVRKQQCSSSGYATRGAFYYKRCSGCRDVVKVSSSK